MIVDVVYYNCTKKKPKFYFGVFPLYRRGDIFQFDHLPSEEDKEGLPYLYTFGPFQSEIDAKDFAYKFDPFQKTTQ